ncbi:hypothetical protein VE03_06779 [Pseudogymnoascus sp. 23342-1-I1]|nr:hypothetical protein VE03_06779 [Pseudogymnoascus sp. 23342-1-I1]
MRSSAFALISLLTTAHSAHLPPARRIPRPVDQSINPRAEYIGGWAWSTSGTCSGAWSESCGTSNNSCCPTGETCFRTGYGAYCCPTSPSPPALMSADCLNTLLTLPACADQSMEMYLWPYSPRFFCCLPGLVAITPYSGDGGLCLPADQNIPATQILTASQQVGVGISRTSIPVVSATNPPSSGTITGYTPSIPTSSSSTSCTSTSCATETPTGAGENSSSSSSNHGLSTSAIGGIAAAGAFLAIIALVYIRRTRKQKKNIASRVTLYPTHTPRPGKPMYVATGQPYYNPQPPRGPETSSAPALRQSANTQSPIPAGAVPVSPLSARVASPPPPYGSTPAAQYGELHGQPVGPGELNGGDVGAGRGQGWSRSDGRESVTGRQEM